MAAIRRWPIEMQVADQAPRAGQVVPLHQIAIEPLDAAVHQHEGELALDEREDVGLRAIAHRRNQEPLDLVRNHVLDVLPLERQSFSLMQSRSR